LLDILCFTQAREHLAQARIFALASGSAHWKYNSAGSLAVALIREGDLTAATTLLNDTLPEDAQYHTQGRRCVWLGRVELTLARGQPEVALQMADELLATTPNSECGIPLVQLIRGRALDALGRMDEAEAAVRLAREQARVEGRPGMVWRANLCLGHILRTQRRTVEAEAAYRDARSVIDEIAAALTDPEIRTTFARATAGLLPAVAATARRVDAGRYGGLTAREREVALLVAQGKSNRNIAGDLVVSERTVETHVTNILLKLGFSSRAQIAAWVVQVGLAHA
jgi:DNA-binding NarL/FixJ family response regulator